MDGNNGQEALKSEFAMRLKTLVSGYYSANQFAKLCGIQQSLLRKYLNAISLPGLDKLVAIASATGVSVEWLATGKGSMRPEQASKSSDNADGRASASGSPRNGTGPQSDDERSEVAFLKEKIRALEEENQTLRERVHEQESKEGIELLREPFEGPWHEAWPVLSVIATHHPQPIDAATILAELDRRRIPRTRTQVAKSLLLLRRQGLIVRSTEDPDTVTLAHRSVTVETRDLVNVSQHASVAMQTLAKSIIPAVEAGGGKGYLFTSEVTVPPSQRHLPRAIVERVRDLCSEANADGASSMIEIVLGVAFIGPDQEEGMPREKPTGGARSDS